MASGKEYVRGAAFAGAVALLAALPAAIEAGHSTGHTQWTNNCAGCHGTSPDQARFNAAGTDRGTLDYVITQVGSMSGLSGSISTTNRDAIAQYIASVLPSTATSASTAMNTGVVINVGSSLMLGGYAFTHVRTTTNPSNGTLTYSAGVNWPGTAIIYTPSAGFVGYDSFTYRGYSAGHTTADSRTMTIQVGTAPNVTSSGTKSGTVGTALSYTITADNAATSFFSSGAFPGGVSRSGSLISGTPTTAGTYNLNLQAFNSAFGWGPSKSLTMTIGKGSQTISFTQPPTPITFGSPGSFGVSATATSGLAVSFSSLTNSVCTVSGSTVSVVTAGTCTIAANQAGNANWFAASQATRNVVIDKANQTITFTQPTTPISYSQGGSFGLSASSTSSLTVAFTSATPAVCSVAGSTASILTAGTCTINANQAGNINYNAASQVQRSVVINGTAPGVPTGVSATAGDASASVSFTAPVNNGGSAITGYTATCSAAGQPTRMANGAASPLAVSALTNGVTYSCTVTATNATGTSGSSLAAGVTPSPTPVAPAFTSASNTTFTVLAPGTFTLTASGIPAPTFSLVGGGLPSGVTLNATTGVLSGTPASGTAGGYTPTFRASNSAGNVNQVFNLTVAKADQVISFTDPADRDFGFATVPLSATSSSGLTVAFTSATPGVCSVSGTNATLLSVGTCTINADQAGNANYNAAPQAQQSFTIDKGDQAITFAAQSTPSRTFSTGGTFSVSPTASASSGLAVSYSSASPSVCSVAGTTVTMLGVGTCTIQADQAGSANWNPAPAVSQNVTVTQGSQTITFPVQAPRSYSPSGTFPVDPPATSSSGLAVTYSTNTPPVCTVSGATVTIVAAGTCTLAADQAGDGNFTAAPTVTRSFAINATAPAAPTIGTATASASGQLSIAFTAPANDGGSPITGYTATCNPGAASASGTASPLLVTGLANNTLHTCSVTATNAIGTSSASASVNGTPSASGPATWASVCSACHGDVPAGARFNAAGSTITVLNHVIATQPDMAATPGVTSLSDAQRADLVAHISSYLAPVQQTTAPEVPKTISVGAHLVLSGISFNQVEVVTPPASGTLGTFSGTGALYTPAAGFSGSTTFQYRGRHTGTGLVGDTHTATIHVDPAARVLTLTLAGAAAAGEVAIADPGGIQFCSSDCTQVYDDGTLVQLYATPLPGYVFVGWGGACSGSGDCLVTMSASRAVTATFGLDQHELAVTLAGTGAGNVSSSPAGIDCGATCAANFAEDTVVTLTAAAAANSTFTGWSGGGCSGSGTCVVTMDAARSVTATFTLVTHALNVSRAGTGSGSVSSTPAGIDCGATCTANITHGTLVTLTASAAAGSTFTGWAGACTGTGACVVTMDAAKSVTATFTPSNYALSISRAGTGAGSVGSAPSGITCGAACTAGFDHGTVVTLTAAANAGSVFTGWSGGGCSGTGTCVVTMDAAKSVTATFTLNTYTLTVSRSGTGTGVMSSAPVGIDCGPTCGFDFGHGTVVTLSATPTSGSTFSGWSGGGCSGTGSCVVTMDAARSVTASFAAPVPGSNALTITRAGTGSGTVSSSPAGIDCGATCSVGFVENTVVTLTASAATGSTFTGWSGNGCSGTGSCVVTMDAAHSVTATFTLETYTLAVSKAGSGSGSVSSAPAGIDCGATCSAGYAYGTTVTLTATAAGGSVFAGWSGGGCAGSGTCIVAVDAAKAVTATFTLAAAGTQVLTVTRAGSGSGAVSSSPAGIDCGATCTAPFTQDTVVTLFATADSGSTFAGWSGDCTGNGLCNVTLAAARNVTATFNAAAGALAANVQSLDFGIQSMGTTSQPMTVTLTNPGPSPVTVGAVSLSSAEFGRTHDCATVPVGGSCTVTVTFSPAVAAGLLNATVPVGGTLNVSHDGAGGNVAVIVFGTGEKSLVTHYYQSTLRRQPDASGHDFWRSEVSRVVLLGAHPNEAWYALGASFLRSGEYAALGRDAAGFVTDLYTTFLGRSPDGPGLAYWSGLIAQGLPRDAVMTSFMFSPEFAALMRTLFGDGAARAEVDMVMDFYRGLLARLPDSDGFNHWVQRFRAAQCQGADAVYREVEAISAGFMSSAEYLARLRSDAEFVSDMYATFMRRGGDLPGLTHWVGTLAGAPFSHNAVRRAFIASPEFAARVQAVIAQGCG